MCKIVGVNARDDSDLNGCDSFISCAASQPEAMIETPDNQNTWQKVTLGLHR